MEKEIEEKPIKKEPSASRRRDDYEVAQSGGGFWIILNTTQRKTLMGEYASREAAERIILRIKTSISAEVRAVLSQLWLLQPITEASLTSKVFPDTHDPVIGYSPYVRKALGRLRSLRLAEVTTPENDLFEKWTVTDKGKAYLGHHA